MQDANFSTGHQNPITGIVRETKMAQKRSRENLPVVSRNKSRKQRKIHSTPLVRAKNSFELLPEDANTPASDNDIILLDSSGEDDGDIVVESDTASNYEEDEPLLKKQRTGNEDSEETYNELSKNNDFIEFGFSLSENEEEDFEQYSDDGIISDDNSGSSHARRDSAPAFAWVKGHDHLKQKEIADWLTLEIKDFVNYISPSKEEIVIRNTVISNLKKSISSFWPTTQAHVFGSCATDLYLPGSDIDMVIISSTGDYEQRSRLYQLSSFLRTNKIAKNIEVIATAKVPIIKFVDPKYNIHVDLSFERTNGLDAARRIRRWLDSTPGLRELVLIVKQFLRSRKLNNVHVGGLGGYATIIMVYHFLRLHPRVSTGNMAVLENLGTLLIEFFELYGRNFSYDNLIIAIDSEHDSPKYLLKSRNPVLNAGRGQFSIIIQDPSDPANNITRSSYNLRDLKKAFGGAYQLLIDKCYDLNGASYKNRIGSLILGDIIKFKGKDRDFNDDRDKIINSALISNVSDDESDGVNGNDKYYFSDMTAGSDDDTFVDVNEAEVPVKPHGVRESQRAKKSKTPEPKNIEQEVNTKDESKQQVADFMSINNDTDDEDNEDDEDKKSKSNLDKDIKREYWRQKGLEI